MRAEGSPHCTDRPDLGLATLFGGDSARTPRHVCRECSLISISCSVRSVGTNLPRRWGAQCRTIASAPRTDPVVPIHPGVLVGGSPPLVVAWFASRATCICLRGWSTCWSSGEQGRDRSHLDRQHLPTTPSTRPGDGAQMRVEEPQLLVCPDCRRVLTGRIMTAFGEDVAHGRGE
jgi:hypothetical protein